VGTTKVKFSFVIPAESITSHKNVAGPVVYWQYMTMQVMNSCGCMFVVVFLYPTILSLMSVVKCVPVYISLGLYNTIPQS